MWYEWVFIAAMVAYWIWYGIRLERERRADRRRHLEEYEALSNRYWKVVQQRDFIQWKYDLITADIEPEENKP